MHCCPAAPYALPASHPLLLYPTHHSFVPADDLKLMPCKTTGSPDPQQTHSDGAFLHRIHTARVLRAQSLREPTLFTPENHNLLRAQEGTFAGHAPSAPGIQVNLPGHLSQCFTPGIPSLGCRFHNCKSTRHSCMIG